MKPWRILMLLSAWVLLAGLVMRWMGIDHAGWLIGGAIVVPSFLFLLSLMRERWKQPADAPERRARWID
jgi:hypothetical protein